MRVLVVFAAVASSLVAQQPQQNKPWMDRSLSPDRRADLVIAQMTLDEKLSLIHGAGMVGLRMPVDPSAKLPVTFPCDANDLAHPQIPGPPHETPRTPRPFLGFAMPELPLFDIVYNEGLKVGYGWFDAEHKQPLFPFGSGLTYTTFTYSGMKLDPSAHSVTFTLKNTGERSGSEVAQVYVTLPARAGEPFDRLVASKKVALAPRESKTVTIAIEPQYLKIFNPESNGWPRVPGEYVFHVGASSRDLPLQTAASLE